MATAAPPHRSGHDLVAGIDRELAAFLHRKRADAAAIDPVFAESVDVLTTFVLGGGKRLRPTFTWWGWRGAGGRADGSEADAVVRAAGALELLQACALVHDDLIDESTTRRGAPTVQIEFARHHRESRWAGSPERFGTAVAILLGDLALAWADDMFRDSGLATGPLRRALPVWSAMRTEVLGGQILDVVTQARGDESPAAALRVNRYKTAAYTVERPLQLGAEMAGAGPELISAYRRFGADLGIAFQLRDDLLGMFGDPQVTGKPAGDDLREGKRTLLLAEGMAAAAHTGHAETAELLRTSIGDPELTPATVAAVRDALVELGAVDAVERRIAKLTESALQTLRGCPVAEPAAARLAELAVAATTRTR